MSRTENAAAPDRRELNRKHCRSGLYKVVHAIFAAPVRFCHRIKVRGRENEPRRGEGSYLVVCNHLTWRDPIFLCASLSQQQPHFMAKKELFRIPIFNWMIKALGAYPVNRGGADVGAIKRTIKLLEEGRTVGMFPQGHRNPGVDPRTTRIHAGAAMIAVKAGVPLLPVYIKTPGNRMKAFCRKEVIIGKPITPEEMAYDPARPGEFDRIIQLAFERVCALGDEEADGCR